MKLLFRSLLSAAAILILGGGVAVAKDHGLCQNDIQKYCAGVEPGKGGIWQCLQSHEKDLSATCRGKMEKRRAAHQSCQADREKFCKDAKPGENGLQCMLSHEKDLSPDCRVHIQKKAARHQKMAACKVDKEKFCANVEPGEGRVRACLKQHEKEVSAQCRDAWSKSKKS